MATALTKTVYTPEDLLRMPDGDRYELVNGNLVERNVSSKATFAAGRLHALLLIHADANSLGWAFPDGTTYQCFPDDPGRVRRPDTSFIRLARFSVEQFNEEGHIPICPDMTTEAVSPNDSAYEIEERVQDFLNAGARLVWVLYPLTRSIRVHRHDGTVSQLREQDQLSGEDLIPGFSCRVGDLFRAAAGAK